MGRKQVATGLSDLEFPSPELTAWGRHMASASASSHSFPSHKCRLWATWSAQEFLVVFEVGESRGVNVDTHIYIYTYICVYTSIHVYVYTRTYK